MDPGAASVIRDEAGALATTAKFQPAVYELESAMKDGVVQKSEVSVAGEAGTRFLFSEETDGTFTVVHYNSRTKKCSQHQATFKDAENLAMSYVTSSADTSSMIRGRAQTSFQSRLLPTKKTHNGKNMGCV